MFDIYTTPITRPLRKTTGGKIHAEGCGNSLRSSRPMRDTAGQTYAALIEKYGESLCQKCFGKAVAKMESHSK